MLYRLVLLAAVCGLAVRAAPASEALEKRVVLVASPPRHRLDGDKQVFEIPRSDVFVNVKFGTKDNSPNNSVVLTLESTAPGSSAAQTGPTTSWVYGTSCTDNSCPPANQRYDPSGGTAGADVSLTGFTGKWYTDSITIGQNAKVSTDFVALSQRYNAEQNNGGLLSLGIGASHGAVDQLFGIGKEKFITIWTDNQGGGQLVIGRNGHDKCNNAALWQTTGDAWEVPKSVIEVGDNKKTDQSVGFSITTKTTKIPSDSYDAVVKDAKIDSNGVVDDISKLKEIKITIGSNSWTLKPEDITWKDSNGKQNLQLQKSPDSNPAITLGVPFLTNRCLVLDGHDTDKTKWQVGVGDPKSGAGVFGLSALLLSIVSVFHFLRL